MLSDLDGEITRYVREAGPRGRSNKAIVDYLFVDRPNAGRTQPSVTKKHLSALRSSGRLARIGVNLNVRYVAPIFAGGRLADLLREMRDSLPTATVDGVLRPTSKGLVHGFDERVLFESKDRLPCEAHPLFPYLQEYETFEGRDLTREYATFKAQAIEFNKRIDELDRMISGFVVRLLNLPRDMTGRKGITPATERWLRHWLLRLVRVRMDDFPQDFDTFKSTVQSESARSKWFVYRIGDSEMVRWRRLSASLKPEKDRLDRDFRRILSSLRSAILGRKAPQTVMQLVECAGDIRRRERVLGTARASLLRLIDEAIAAADRADLKA